MTDTTLIERLREDANYVEDQPDFVGSPAYSAGLQRRAADALAAAQARIAELERRLGGGCDARNGGDHKPMSDGTYKFCSACGESLHGVRYCHEPREPKALKKGGE